MFLNNACMCLAGQQSYQLANAIKGNLHFNPVSHSNAWKHLLWESMVTSSLPKGIHKDAVEFSW